MSRLKAEVVLQLMDQLLDQGKADLKHPALAWQVEGLTTAAADLRAALGIAPAGTAKIDGLRAKAAAADDAHDDAHRALSKLFQPFLHRGPEAERLVVAQGLEVLYPEGIAFVRSRWIDEVGATLSFEARLKHEAVVPALSVLRKSVPALDEWTAAAVHAGKALGAALAAMDQLIADRPKAAKSAQLFQARSRALSLLSLLRTTIDHAFPAGTAANDKVRQTLLGPLTRATAEG